MGFQVLLGHLLLPIDQPSADLLGAPCLGPQQSDRDISEVDRQFLTLGLVQATVFG